MRYLLLSFFILFLYSCKQPAREKNFIRQIGVYSLDLKRTDLKEYRSDSIKLKNLRITFNKDSTFTINMSVPFIFEEHGKWVADGGDFESWNWLSYDSWLKKERLEIGNGQQFTEVYLENKDSIFYINGATPKENNKFIQEIYFKKILK